MHYGCSVQLFIINFFKRILIWQGDVLMKKLIIKMVICTMFITATPNVCRAEKLISLPTGYYLITDVSTKLESDFSSGTMLSKKEIEQMLSAITKQMNEKKDTLYLYYDSASDHLSFFKDNIEKKRPLIKRNNGTIVTDVMDEECILLQSNESVFIVKNTLNELFFSGEIEFVCQLVSESNKKLAEIKQYQQEKEENYLEFLRELKPRVVMNSEQKKIEGVLWDKWGMSLRLALGEQLEKSLGGISLWSVDKLLISSNNEQCERFIVGRRGMNLAKLPGNADDINIDRMVGNTTHYPEEVFYKEPNGIIYYSKENHKFIGTVFHYDSEEKIYRIGQVSAENSEELDSFTARYKQIRTLIPAFRGIAPCTIDFERLMELSDDKFISQFPKEDWEDELAEKIRLKIKESLAPHYFFFSLGMIQNEFPIQLHSYIGVSIILVPPADAINKIDRTIWNAVYESPNGVLLQHKKHTDKFSVKYYAEDNGVTYCIALREGANVDAPTAIKVFRNLQKMSLQNMHNYSPECIEQHACKYSDTSSQGHDVIKVTTKNKKSGIILANGKIIVPIEYDNIEIEENGYVVSRGENRTGWMTLDGREILPCIYSFISVGNHNSLHVTKMVNDDEWKASVFDLAQERFLEPFE